jgi:hypothetical protein
VKQNVPRETPDDLVDSLPGGAVRELDRLSAADVMRLTDHPIQVDIHVRGEIELVDDQEVALHDSRPTAGRGVLPCADV